MVFLKAKSIPQILSCFSPQRVLYLYKFIYVYELTHRKLSYSICDATPQSRIETNLMIVTAYAKFARGNLSPHCVVVEISIPVAPFLVIATALERFLYDEETFFQLGPEIEHMSSWMRPQLTISPIFTESRVKFVSISREIYTSTI